MRDTNTSAGASNTPQRKSLFNEEAKDFNTSLLEQYKLYVQTANATSATRVQANNFFLTINSVIVGLIVGTMQFTNTLATPLWVIYSCLIGIVLAACWYVLIRSYRDLNSARFRIIQELESRLPANIYKREWDIAMEERPKRRYIRQTDIEQFVPMGFGGLYVLLILVTILLKALGFS